MRRRDWLMALASGLGLSLACGCSRGTPLQTIASPPVQQATAPAAPPQTLASPPAVQQAAAPAMPLQTIASPPVPQETAPAAPLPAATVALQSASPYGTVPAPAPHASGVVAPAGESQPAAAAPQAAGAIDPPPASAEPRAQDQPEPRVLQAQAPAEPIPVQLPGAAPFVRTVGDAAFAVQPDLEPNLADPPVVLALRFLLENPPRLADAVHVLDNYDQQTQNLLLCLLPVLAHLSDKGIKQADGERMAIWVDELERILDPLRRHACLGLEKMCFCSCVKRFGVYQPLPTDHAFRPGDPVQIYVEYRNFVCTPHDVAYEIHLASQVRLTRQVDGKERIEWEQGIPDRYQPDRSQSQRHDYCGTYCFSIPPNLPLGDYSLTLRVVDLGTTPPRVVERSLPLHLTTRPGM
jgi:hypothetical protein